MGQDVFILDRPIVGKSGTVSLTFYNSSVHPSWTNVPFWFILYERTGAGVFTVAAKKSVDTPASAGSFNVETEWEVTDDKIYYVGVWRNGSAYAPYVSAAEGMFYKADAYSSDSDFAVGSTLDYTALNYASNTIQLNISVLNNGKHYERSIAKKRLVHFSVDDCVFWADLITNGVAYTSCFENVQLGYWKRLHDIYGVCVTLNCFCSDGMNSIKDVPDKFAEEFKANAGWLKFAFHAEDAMTHYDTDKVDAITTSYNTFVAAIVKMTGTTDTIDPVTRLGFYSGTLANIQAIRDAKCGITGLLTADDTRISYYFDAIQNNYILAHNYFTDAKSHIVFIHTMPRLENVSDTISALNSYMGEDWQNQNEFLEFFTHETAMTSSRVLQLETYCNWAYIIGADFGFTKDVLLNNNSSTMYNSENVGY